MSNNILSESIRRAESIIASVKESRDRFEIAQRKSWNNLAGARSKEMLDSYQKTVDALDDCDKNVRVVALEILLGVWKAKLSPEFLQKCVQLAISDPSLEVRSMAIIALGTCHENSHDLVIGRLLAEIVKDTSQQMSIRHAAYHSIFTISGRIADWIDMNCNASNFPHDVDWKFVNMYLNAQEL